MGAHEPSLYQGYDRSRISMGQAVGSSQPFQNPPSAAGSPMNVEQFPTHDTIQGKYHLSI